MKVIFLDVDGVLIPYGSVFMKKKELHPDCANCLKQIVQRTGAKIVVTSTWRLQLDRYESLLQQLKTYGLDEAVIDKTDAVWKEGDASLDRKAEIAKWLAAHPEVTRTLVIDDELFLHQPNGGQLVTTYNVGLVDCMVPRGVEILNRG